MFEKFFNHPSFDFETRNLFGAVHYGAGDVGEMFTAVANITDGDAASRVSEWRTLSTDPVDGGYSQRGGSRGQRPQRLSESSRLLRRFECLCRWHGERRRPARRVVAAHRRCFDLHVGLLDPPAIPISVPYEGGDLPGYLFIPAADVAARPTSSSITEAMEPIRSSGRARSAGSGPGLQHRHLRRARAAEHVVPTRHPLRPTGSAALPRWWTT